MCLTDGETEAQACPQGSELRAEQQSHRGGELRDPAGGAELGVLKFSVNTASTQHHQAQQTFCSAWGQGLHDITHPAGVLQALWAGTPFLGRHQSSLLSTGPPPQAD